jgi:Asp-tRNA(Asn)/Glu-tRNA(Gln) amidotransferase C subunit
MASRHSFAYSISLIRPFSGRFISPYFVRQPLMRWSSSITNPHTAQIEGNGPMKTKRLATSYLRDVLAKPTWSVSSLLPPAKIPIEASKISSSQLYHLLRLSALPLPETLEEATMLQTLSAQLHFAGEIQQVDTTDVTPLRSIRDETVTAEKDQTITLDTLKESLLKEEVIGKYYKRIQRKTGRVGAKDVEDWDVLGFAERKVGKYFVVESERP